ncbi:hypothetical protein ACFXPX_04935 [Kitasatospora sp. NPDC059146]|uniref:hypothetical protein n=1 Tax=unclassified Kitasatospora TaxID=2633591 RepID=UPI003677EFE4
MSTAAQYADPTPPPMTNVREVRAALAGLAALGVPTELDRFEQELDDVPLHEFEDFIQRYKTYVEENTTPEAVAALTMPVATSAAQLRRKLAEAGR